MSVEATTRGGTPPRAVGNRLSWRVVDIVTASVLAVVCGVIYWIWSAGWTFITPAFAAFPPGDGILSGTWVLAGPLAGLIIRKPGAALYAEVLAAVTEAVLGSHFGFSILLTSPIQGLAAELAFAVFAYRRFGFPVVLFSGLLTGTAQGCIDNIVLYAEWLPVWKTSRIAFCAVSGLLMAGLFVWWIVRVLARAGALTAFAAGRGADEAPGSRGSAAEATAGSDRTRATATGAPTGTSASGSPAPGASADGQSDVTDRRPDDPAVVPAEVVARDFSYRHAGRKRAAFSHLSLTIPAGQKVLLAGASGAGKSTFLHALAGVLPAESGYATGELLVAGAAPDPTRGTCGLVLQDPDSQAVMSKIGHDVTFGLENLRVPAEQIPARVARALDLVGLDYPLDHPTTALSGGQKQRLAIAGVVAMRPGLLILDEPTANLDPEAAVAIRDVIVDAATATGATVVLVEHRLPLWAEHVDRIVVLGASADDAEGTRIIADGSPKAVLGDELLRPHLRAAGLWLPGEAVEVPDDIPDGSLGTTDTGQIAAVGAAGRDAPGGDAASGVAPAQPLLSTHALQVGRESRAVARVPGLELHPGTVLAVRGPNGAGKTTTALTLAGLLPPVAGDVVAGEGLVRLPGAARVPKSTHPGEWSSKELVERIGMVFQEPEHQFMRPSVRAELEYGPQRAGWAEADVAARTAQLLDALRLTPLAQAHPNTLSGGEKRRLSVAAMIAARPPVLIVDEPTFGQDALTWGALVELFEELIAGGTAIVAVTHDADFATAIGARTVHVDQVGNAGRRA
ncbi:ECF transporter S component [Brevibacterium moorei]|uniref:ECF transporter S component n=1 Tax=Brevibacterium moorei TaxID=2968457 RepID=UPI00211CDB32|nr:ECF transporter S component [Brevibacterium sp. 68QC2CO]